MTPQFGNAVSRCAQRRIRGSAFIATIGVILVITGTVLVLARSMRVEAIASANRLSEVEADAAQRGVEQFLRSVVDAEIATPGSTSRISMEARQLGNCWFWVLKPDPDNDRIRAYGLTDEGGKLDLNTASYYMLSMLPNMSADVASSIFNWRGAASYGYGLGATDADYQALAPPYQCKHAPFETTQELLLVKNVDDALLFGSDRNRDGWISSQEFLAGGRASSVTSTSSSARGIFPCVTAYGYQATSATLSTSGQRLVDVNVTATEARGGPEFNDTALRRSLQSAGVANVGAALRLGEAAQSQIGNFQTVLQWAAYANLSSSDYARVYNILGATPPGGGSGDRGTMQQAKINVNTAPREVLLCLPGFQESDADAIVAHRQFTASADPRDLSWLLDAVPRDDLKPAAGNLTGASCVYSADIVAVSSDGRAFSRCRVVINGAKTPSFVVYREDLHRFGWPLNQDIRNALRRGQAPPDANASVANGS